jgi:hypothetical protein
LFCHTPIIRLPYRSVYKVSLNSLPGPPFF